MIDSIRRIRFLLSTVLLAGAAFLALTPGTVQAEDPCEFGHWWNCTSDKAHRFQGECEGMDCYFLIESCCEMPT